MEGNAKITLRIPPQDQTEFTLFPLNAHAAAGWAQALPVTNTEAVVDLLDQALTEISRVRLSAESRYEILEALVPSLDVALTNLAKRFLNQPLIMPTGPQKMADVAARLNTRACTAYTVTAAEAIRNRDAVREINPALLACQALQRALIYAGRNVLQTFQLFRPLDIQGWRSLHQLYALAESQGLAELPLPDARGGAKTVRNTYLRAVLLGCCKPNRLRQGDLTLLYDCLAQWAEDVTLAAADAPEGLFLVDLQSDQPPLYRTLYKSEPGPQCRTIDTTRLVARLQRESATEKPKARESNPDALPAGVLDHVINSLGRMSLRNFKRSASNSELRICIGLRNVHYHVGGETPFEDMLQSQGFKGQDDRKGAPNLFLEDRNKIDVWRQANPGDYAEDPGEQLLSELEHGIDIPAAARAAMLNEAPTETPTDDYPIYRVQMTDASPGGYCLEWNSKMPTDIRSGDIVGLKEDDSKDWAIAVIRWFGRFGQDRTLIGLELMSPRAVALGASVQQKTSHSSPPIRILQLPQIKLVGQPNTLIMPRAGFREGQKVNIYTQQEKRAAQLLRMISATGTFAQFDYKFITSLGEILSTDEDVKLGADYDSVWSNI